MHTPVTLADRAFKKGRGSILGLPRLSSPNKTCGLKLINSEIIIVMLCSRIVISQFDSLVLSV